MSASGSPVLRRFTVLKILVKRRLEQQRETCSLWPQQDIFLKMTSGLLTVKCDTSPCVFSNQRPGALCLLYVSYSISAPAQGLQLELQVPHYSTVTMIFPLPVKHALAFITCTHGTLRRASPGGAM